MRLDIESGIKEMHPVMPESLHAEILSIVKRYPHCRIEDKRYTFSIHAGKEDQSRLKEDLKKALDPHGAVYSFTLYGGLF